MQSHHQALTDALHAHSPRYRPGPPSMAGILIHTGVFALWVGLFAGGFVFSGLAAWATGVLYALYDTVLLVFTAVSSRAMLAPRPLPAAGLLPGIGVVIAAHDEAPVLKVTLDSLLAQEHAPEVIVLADDGSTDGSDGVLAAHFGLAPSAPGCTSEVQIRGIRLVWLRLTHGGKARALNAALGLLRTEVIVTVDADTLLKPDALEAVARAFAANPDLVGATGVLAPLCDANVSGRLFQWFQTYEYVRNFLARFAWMRQDSLLLISGALGAFRRSALLTVGGFDADCLVEDYELIHRLKRYAGRHGLPWHTAVLGGAFAWTHAPGTVPAFLRQRRRWFGGFLQTQYWYREMVGDARYGRLGTLMLPVKAFDAVQPLFGLSALLLLLDFALTGRVRALIPAGGVIAAKIGIDLCYHAWSVHAYRRWIGSQTRVRIGVALLAALAEPFCFQILRHLGASLGWITFLGGARQWGRQERSDLGAGRARETAALDVLRDR